MLDYCMCPKCERMIMLDSDFETGFCLYCGTHISYQDSREFLLEGLKSAVPDDMKIEADLSELIDEDDAYTDAYGTDECRTECSKAQEYMGKWDFANAFKHYTAALDYPEGLRGVLRKAHRRNSKTQRRGKLGVLPQGLHRADTLPARLEHGAEVA
ncbi:MAG: hypothetical protein ACLSG5_10045 [Oscillospiraceae bacterium]